MMEVIYFIFFMCVPAMIICDRAGLNFFWTIYAIFNGLDLKCQPTELLFFPDPGLPCNSYYLNKPCYKRSKCEYLHKGQNSSLMKVMDTMKDAKQIDLCMFRFTLEKVADLFEKLHRQGTRIRIITDKSHESIDNDQIPRLKGFGIEVRERSLDPMGNDRSRPLMHNKFVIVDRKCCLLGSFNWTYHAVTKNSETIIKSYEPTVVEPLVRKFEEMWRNLAYERRYHYHY